jgi:5-methylcytosine-specific restriction protein A
MKTYLFTWNPRRSPELEMPRIANETAAGKTVQGRWSSGNTKTIQRGDRVFLIRLGVEPKGIVGSGWIDAPPHEDVHWDSNKATQGLKGLFVMCDWERIIDTNVDSPLLLEQLADLAIVCPNCHAMIHRGGKCRSLESLILRK